MNHVTAGSANELYQLRKQLPEFGTLKKPDLIIKDYNYYKDNTFHWNRPSHSCKKMYPFYHKVNDENMEKIEQMKEQQMLDKKLYEDIRKDEVIRNKSQDLVRHSNRKAERKVLQFESSQRLDLENDKDLYETIMSPEVTSRVHSR
jgi:hypothetical protein